MSEKRTTGMKRAVDKIRARVRRHYDTDTDFHRSSGLSCAYYTVRRVFDNEVPAPTFETLAIVAQAAGFAPAEIKALLIEAGDKNLNRMIGGDDTAVSAQERSMIGAVRKVSAADPKTWVRLADSLELWARAAGVEIGEDIKGMG